MPFKYRDAITSGCSPDAIRWKIRRGELQQVARGVLIKGAEPITDLEKALALIVATDGVASGSLTGVLYELDAVELKQPYVDTGESKTRRAGARRRNLEDASEEVRGVQSVSVKQALLDLAEQQDDITWEQTLESALRKKLVLLEELEIAAVKRPTARSSQRTQRVLALRPPHAPPTESLLETLAVQLIRKEEDIPTPSRQVIVTAPSGRFIARVDLAWPEIGVFMELYGSQHADQWVYDARRETDVAATTGWIPGRFTWNDIVRTPTASVRRIAQLINQASSKKNGTLSA